MTQPTHHPDAVLTLRVAPALRARIADLLARVPDTGAARLSRHGLACWCLERGLLAAEADPGAVLRAPQAAPPPVAPAARRARAEGAAVPSQAEARARVEAAREAGVGVAEVAARAGVPRASVYRWIKGERELSPEHLASVARALGELGA